MSYQNYKILKSKEIYELGIEFKEKENLILAKKYLESALEIDFGNKLAFRELLDIYNEEKDLNQAVSLFKKLLQNQTNDLNYYFYSKFLFENSKYKAAVHYLKKSLYQNKKFLPAHNLLAEIYYLHGQKKLAEQYLRNSIKLDSTNEKNLQMLIHILYHQKNFEDCLEYLEKYLKLNPIDKDEVLRKIKILLKLDKELEAFNYLVEFLDSHENNSFLFSINQQNDPDLIQKLLELRTVKLEELKNKNSKEDSLKLNLEISLINLFLGQRKKAIKFIIDLFKLKE